MELLWWQAYLKNSNYFYTAFVTRCTVSMCAALLQTFPPGFVDYSKSKGKIYSLFYIFWINIVYHLSKYNCSKIALCYIRFPFFFIVHYVSIMIVSFLICDILGKKSWNIVNIIVTSLNLQSRLFYSLSASSLN